MKPSTQSKTAQALIILAAFIIVVAGLKTAAPILVPFLLSGFIAIIAAPPMFWLTRRGVPKGVSLLIVVCAVLLMGGLVGLIFGTSVDDFTRNLPEYQSSIREKAQGLIDWLAGLGVPLNKQGLMETFDPGAAMKLAGNTLAGFGNVLANTFLILLTVVFLLFEAAGLPNKLERILSDPEDSMARLGDIATKVQRYMELKAVISVGTGVAVGLWTWIAGLDFPLIWAVLAFLLNFVPNIGSIIAAVPAVLLAIVQLSPGGVAFVVVGYALVNIIMGNVVEPRVMGRDLGLSTLVVFLSLVFWGWVLGPVGMLLSVPLTMTAKIVLDASDDTRWVAVLLGPDPDAVPSSSGRESDDTEADELDKDKQ
ncbi:MAG: AI-2E family transporter [Gammaproteobacteria bacterium]